MAADKSLKELSGAVFRIAENQPKIQSDVKDIRDAICSPAGILEAVNAINDRLDKAEKKTRLDRLKRTRSSELNNKNLVKNTDSISKNLSKILKNTDRMAGDNRRSSMGRTLDRILDQVRRLSGKNRETSTKRMRLHEENFRRDGDRKIKHLEGISKSIEIIERLKDLRLRDFTFAKRKLRNIRDMMSRFRDMFKMFKNQKEVDGTMEFADRSIELTQKLKKVALISGLAKLGERTLEKIFLGRKRDKGKGGLLYLFREIAKPKNDLAIKVGKKSIDKILKACGSMLLASMALTGIAVIGIPAMLGALMMKGIVFLMIGTFKMLRKARKSVIKGSAVMLIMSTSVITFALGLGLMTMAVKNMKLKDVGLMIASIAGIGLTIAGIGLLAVPIAIGSASLLLMGASLGIFGLAMRGWEKIDAKKSIGNVKLAVEGLREAFGLELGKSDGKKNVFQRLGGGIMGIAMGLLNFGEMFFIMGSLLLAGISLGFLYHGMKKWDTFNGKKAAANIKVGVGALKDAFGIGESKNMGVKGKLKRLTGGPLDIVNSILDGGRALVEMGVITLAVGMADMIRVLLIPWNKYNPSPAAGNIKLAVDALKDVFGLGGNPTGLNAKGVKLGGDLMDTVSSLLNGASTLMQMGTIMLSVLMLDVVKKGLEPWENYDATKPAANISKAVDALSDTFGLKGTNDQKVSFGGGLALAGRGLLDMAMVLLQSGSTLMRMGTIALATSMLGSIRENLIPWEDYDSSKPIANIKYAVDNLLDVFGFKKIEREVEDAGGKKSLGDKLKRVLGNVTDFVGNMFGAASALAEGASNMAEGGAVMAKLSSIMHATSAMYSIKGSLEPWDNYDGTTAFNNIRNAVSGINSFFTEIVDIRSKEPKGLKMSNALYFETSSVSIKKGLTNLIEGWERSSGIVTAMQPFKKTVDIINKVDIEKASVMIDLFNSFSKLRNKPFDKFTESVNKFAESSDNLIDALNNFSENYAVSEESGAEGTGESTVKKVEGININNTQALAEAFAEAIKKLPINIETSISDIRLVVNGEAGRRVIVSLDN